MFYLTAVEKCNLYDRHLFILNIYVFMYLFRAVSRNRIHARRSVPTKEMWGAQTLDDWSCCRGLSQLKLYMLFVRWCSDSCGNNNKKKKVPLNVLEALFQYYLNPSERANRQRVNAVVSSDADASDWEWPEPDWPLRKRRDRAGNVDFTRPDANCFFQNVTKRFCVVFIWRTRVFMYKVFSPVWLSTISKTEF